MLRSDRGEIGFVHKLPFVEQDESCAKDSSCSLHHIPKIVQSILAKGRWTTHLVNCIINI